MSRVLPCSPGFLRGALLVLNIIFVLVGITIIVLGIYIKIDSNISTILDRLDAVSNFEGKSLGYLAFIMIGGGIFTLIIAFAGCMGSLWQNRCLLYVYSTILAILMICELVGCIVAFSYKSKLESVYRDSLLDVLTTALNTSDTNVLDAFADLEKSLKCCGVNGIDDYHGREPKNPLCYRYRNGCSDAIIKLFNDNLPIIGTTLGIVLLFELLCLINAILLSISLRNSTEGSSSYSSGNVLINILPGRRKNDYYGI